MTDGTLDQILDTLVAKGNLSEKDAQTIRANANDFEKCRQEILARSEQEGRWAATVSGQKIFAPSLESLEEKLGRVNDPSRDFAWIEQVQPSPKP